MEPEAPDLAAAFDWIQDHAHLVSVVRGHASPEGADKPAPDRWTVRTINPDRSVAEWHGATLLEAVGKAAAAK